MREVITRQPTDASMDGPLPPGAWWVAASKGQRPKPAEPYGPRAGSAAIQAAMAGPLELRNVSFSYPLRPDMPGAWNSLTASAAVLDSCIVPLVSPAGYSRACPCWKLIICRACATAWSDLIRVRVHQTSGVNHLLQAVPA